MLNDLRLRFLQTTLQNDENRAKKIFFAQGIIILFLLGNVVYLNILLHQKQNSIETTTQKQSPSPFISPTAVPSPLVSLTPTPTPSKIQTSSSQSPLVKDYFIPLGSGSSQNPEWTDIPGVQAAIDFGKYQTIKEIRFEASIYVPTGNQIVSARLYNNTDQHPVWSSEVTMKENSTSYLSSSSLVYDKGEKVYQVQMKTQLRDIANLVQSRIHIILK